MNPAARRRARQHALQAIYQWQVSGNTPPDIETDFRENGHFHKGTDETFFAELLHGVTSTPTELDQIFSEFLNIPLPSLDPIELTILRMGTFELAKRPDVPWRVVINEALELARGFGSIEGFRFVNGVLDRVARKLRPDEIAADNSGESTK